MKAQPNAQQTQAAYQAKGARVVPGSHPAQARPIGVFDSGLGGLTVARALAHELPQESILYFGDTARCPYGVRDPHEVAEYVRQITAWIMQYKVKMIVIACNTASAVGLNAAQDQVDVPVFGVIEPGARAVMKKTKTNKVGVLATPTTVNMHAYTDAICAINPQVEVYAAASPRSVEIVENTIVGPHAYGKDWMSDKAYFDTPFNHTVAREDLAPLIDKHVDAVVLGCTHFPLLKDVYADVLGPQVAIVSSAEHTAQEVSTYLAEQNLLASNNNTPTYHFATTSDDVTGFCIAGEYIFGKKLRVAEHVSIAELESL